jgi:outer membrane immunogenic protein
MNMLKASILAAVATALLASSNAAQAADPSSTLRRVPSSPAPAKVQDWSGAYVGVHGGFVGTGLRSKGNVNPALNFTNPPVNGLVNNKDKNKGKSLNGAGGGIQAGYNFQSGSIVYGVEAETTFTGGGKKKSTTNLTAEQSNSSALKAKLGYSFGSTLVYGTAGVAIASTRYNAPAVGAFRAAKKTVTNIGPVVGLGVEQKLTESLSLKGEVEVAGFGKKKLVFPAGTTNVESSQVSAKVGLNYRF